MFFSCFFTVIPSDVSFLCNGMSCGETVRVGQTVICHAHGYPQPDFRMEVFRTPLSMPSEGLQKMIDSVEALENFLDEGGTVRLSDQGQARDILQFIIRMISPLINGLESRTDFDIDSEEPFEGNENLAELVHHFQVMMSRSNVNDSRLNDSFWQLGEMAAAAGRLNISAILDFFDYEVGQRLDLKLLLKNATEKQRRLTKELYEPVVDKIKKKLKDVRKLLAKDKGNNSTLKTKAEFSDDEETEIRIEAIETIADFWELVEKGGDENDIKKAYGNIMLYFIFSDFQLNNTELLMSVNVESKSENGDLNASRSSGLNSNESKEDVFSKETEEMKTAKSSTNTTDKELETLDQSTGSVNSSEHGKGTNTSATNKTQLNNTTGTNDINTESAVGHKDFTADESSDEGDDEDTESRMMTAGNQWPYSGGIKDVEEYVTTESDIGHVELTCNVSNRLGWGFSSIGIDVLRKRFQFTSIRSKTN